MPPACCENTTARPVPPLPPPRISDAAKRGSPLDFPKENLGSVPSQALQVVVVLKITSADAKGAKATPARRRGPGAIIEVNAGDNRRGCRYGPERAKT